MNTETLVLYAHWVHCIGDKCGNKCPGRIAGTNCSLPGYHKVEDISEENCEAFESVDHPFIYEEIPF
jgi:hypothetical protein